MNLISVYQKVIEAKNLTQFMSHTYIQKSLSVNVGLISQFQYFLIQSEIKIYLTTIKWFNELTCNHFPVLKVINTLTKHTGNWTTEPKNHEKFRDFYGCKLIYIQPKLPDDDFFYKHSLIKVILFDILATKGNFHPIRIETDSKGDYHIGNVYLAEYVG